MVTLFICIFITLQLSDELSKVDEKLKLTESLLESKVMFETFNLSEMFCLLNTWYSYIDML